MSKERNYAFDFARAVAIVFIVSCHFLLFNGVEGLASVGRAAANIGNFVFFALSAVLFGLRFESYGKQAFMPIPFMTKRIVRLFASLWPFLVLLIATYYIVGEHLSVIKIFLNIVGLGWFGKLPNNGHLWFVTMIVMCYVMFVIVANTRMSQNSRGGVILPILICVSLEFAVDSKGWPGYLFMVLGYSFCLFKYASKYIQFVKVANVVVIWISLLLSTLFALASCFGAKFEYSLFVQQVAGYVAGFAWLTTLLKYGGKIKRNRMMEHVSKFSYEIYLVHHCFCCGVLSVLQITVYPMLNYAILWSLTLVLAIPLHIVANRINSAVMPKISSILNK